MTGVTAIVRLKINAIWYPQALEMAPAVVGLPATNCVPVAMICVPAPMIVLLAATGMDQAEVCGCTSRATRRRSAKSSSRVRVRVRGGSDCSLGPLLWVVIKLCEGNRRIDCAPIRRGGRDQVQLEIGFPFQHQVQRGEMHAANRQQALVGQGVIGHHDSCSAAMRATASRS